MSLHVYIFVFMTVLGRKRKSLIYKDFVETFFDSPVNKIGYSYNNIFSQQGNSEM